MKIKDKLIFENGRSPLKTATTAERLQKIIFDKNIKQADLARATGISRGAISNYVQGRYEPKADIVQKLANALNCSEMWLWGYDVPAEKTSQLFDEENPYVAEVSDTLDGLEVDHQIYARNWIREFAKNPENLREGVFMPTMVETKKEQPTGAGELSPKRKAFLDKVMQMSDAELDRLERILALVENTK